MCGAIFFLLAAVISLGLTVDFCFPGGTLSRVVSLSVTVMWGGLGCVCGCVFFVTDVSDPCLYAGCVVMAGALS
jgi:hypothetical protein